MSNNNKIDHPGRTGSLSIEAEAVVALLKTVDFINQHSSETMEPFGVTSQQYNILRILNGADPDGLPTLELADRMLVRSPGVTRLIDRLGKKKLVTRKRSRNDRRVVMCKITQKGQELLEEMDRPVAMMNREIVASLDPKQTETLIKLLNQMRNNNSPS